MSCLQSVCLCVYLLQTAENPETKETINTEEIKEAATEALEKGKEVAGEALEKGKEVAGEALEKGKEVAGEALEKGKELVGNVTEAAKNVDVNDIINQAKSGNKKVIGIAVGAVAGVIVLFLLISSLFGGGYMDPVNKYIKMINKQDTDYYGVRGVLQGSKLEKSSAKIREAFIAADAEIYGDSIEDYYEEYTENMEDMYDDVLDEYDSYKVSFEKKDAQKMDKDDLEDMVDDMKDYYEDYVEDLEDTLEDDDDLENFADNYDIDEKDAEKILKAQINHYKQFAEGKITAGYEVKGKFIVKVDGKDEYETDSVKLMIVKFNGQWVYAGCEDYINIDEDGDDEAYVLDSLLGILNNSSLY